MKTRISFDPGAVLLLGLLLFSLSLPELGAMALSAAVHELGHLAAMKVVGVPVYALRFSASGPVLDCAQAQRRRDRVFCALAGPASGAALAGVLHSAWPLCAEMSLLFSAVNLLPVLPLDGGRALHALLGRKGYRLLSVFGFLIPTAAMVTGLYLFRAGYGLALTAFGGWLLLLACQGEENALK